MTKKQEQQNPFPLSIEQVARIGAEQMLKIALNAELEEFKKKFSVYRNGFHKERSGDIAIILEKNIIFYDGKGTTHGSGYNYDTHVPLIFYGKGIKKGETSERTEIPDIAPTISKLLGQQMENSTGNILEFIFE